MKFYLPRLLACFIFFPIASIADSVAQEDVRALANTVTRQDLQMNCPSRFLEIHMEATSSEQAGMAIVKWFWMVDPEFLKRAAQTTSDPSAWGVYLGDTFRRYCEQQPQVNVRTAVKQAIVFMESES